MTALPFHLDNLFMNFPSIRSVINALISAFTWDTASPRHNWIFVLWLETAINTYWSTECTLVWWVLRSDLGYYVVVDLQQNHLNYELCEEEVIKFETLRLQVLRIVINTKSKKSSPWTLASRDVQLLHRLIFYSETSLLLAKWDLSF